MATTHGTKTSKRGQNDAAQNVYQLKVTLREIEPPIWRQIQVPSRILLPTLHHVLQIAMGWMDAHLHHFEADGTRYGQPNPEWGALLRDERTIRLVQLITEPEERICYEYDFGDCWRHDIVLERVVTPEPDLRYPRVVAGARACPPEDCGGAHGYETLLGIIADESHPEHEEMLEWVGGGFDPEAFDVREKNWLLRRRQHR